MDRDERFAESGQTRPSGTDARAERVRSLARLREVARGIVARSTAPEAPGFDVDSWLAVWLDTPQPALKGRRPTDLLDSEEGLKAVSKVLAAIESGSFL